MPHWYVRALPPLVLHPACLKLIRIMPLPCRASVTFAVLRVDGCSWCAGGMYDAFAADVWALGVTLHCLLFKTLPFTGDTRGEMAASIKEDECVVTCVCVCECVVRVTVMSRCACLVSDFSLSCAHVCVFSLCVCIFHILSPFACCAFHRPRMVCASASDSVSDAARDLVRKLLCKDRSLRLTVAECKVWHC